MPRELKVYSGRIYLPNLCRNGGYAVVAARTKKKVRELANISVTEMRDYWIDTANPKATEVAMAHPEKLIVFPEQWAKPDHYYIFDSIEAAWKFGRTP